MKEYSRRIYSVLDLFGDLGGFAEAMVILGSVFVTSIASRMFLASLIRDIYHVRVDTNKTDIDLLRSKLSGNSKRFQEDVGNPEDDESASVFRSHQGSSWHNESRLGSDAGIQKDAPNLFSPKNNTGIELGDL